MTEKVACVTCGAMILAATAAANGGECMPCKRGIRQKLAEGKVRAAERKAVRANPEPATLHWRWLVNEVYRTPSGIGGLSAANQNFFAAFLLEGEVYNGGFAQYFTNNSAAFYAYAVRGLDDLGAIECRDILISAKAVLFGRDDVPATQAARFPEMEKLGPGRTEALNALDRRFGEAASRMRQLGRDYAEKHRLWEGF
jgi:hypothetical protein